MLTGGRLRGDAQIVGDVEMKPAGELDRVLAVGARDARPVVRRQRSLDAGRGRGSGCWSWSGRWRLARLIVDLVLQVLQLLLELADLILQLLIGLCRGGIGDREQGAR